MDGGTTFHFVNDGIESALDRAREAAGNGVSQHRGRGRDAAPVPGGGTRRRASAARGTDPARGRRATLRWLDRRDVRADRCAPSPDGEPPDLQGRPRVSGPEVDRRARPRRRHPPGPVPQVRGCRPALAPRPARSSPTARCWSTAWSRPGADASSSAVPSSRSGPRPAQRGFAWPDARGRRTASVEQMILTILAIVVATTFVFTGGIKLFNVPASLDIRDSLDVPPGLWRVIGVAGVAGCRGRPHRPGLPPARAARLDRPVAACSSGR